MEKRGQTRRMIIRRTVRRMLIALPALPFIISGYVCLSTRNRIIPRGNAFPGDADCILVLGAGVWGDGVNARPSTMLSDRLETAVSLYKSGAAPKLLMSGDHGRKDYDEVNVMKNYAVNEGIPSEDVFMDHAGFSTYDSLYRARDIFRANKVIIVTQEYHLYRALYTARALGIDAIGVSADLRTYKGQAYYSFREVPARCKDFLMALFKPLPAFLGEAVPVSGNGNTSSG